MKSLVQWLAVLVLILIEISLTNAACESGWHYYNQYCYKVENAKYSQSKAVTECRKIGGDLASIHSAEENDFVHSLITSETHIGGLNFGNPAKFHWIDGSLVDYTDPLHVSHAEVSYMINNIRASTVWYAISPTNTIQSLCKKPAEDAVLPKEPCDVKDGWSHFGQACYKCFGELKNQAAAQATCVEYGGNLVSVHSDKEYAYVNARAGGYKQSVYSGAVSLGDGDFYWTDGTPANYTEMIPNGQSKGRCFTLYGAQPKMRSYTCTGPFFYICKKQMSATTTTMKTTTMKTTTTALPIYCNTDEGWILSGESCYKVITGQSISKKNHINALDDCRKNNSDLASVHSSEEDSFLNLKLGRGDRAYIGAISTGNKGYMWTDGSYSDFNERMPDVQEAGLCIVMVGGEAMWEAVRCSNVHGYICMKFKPHVSTV